MLTDLQRERWSPIALGILSGAIGWWLDVTISHWIAKELLSALISAAAICAGFLTTALSIMMTLGGTAIGRQIKRRGKLSHLFAYLREAIYSSLCLCGVCLLGFFQIADQVGMSVWASALVVGCFIYSTFAMVRIVRILSRVIQAMSAPEDSSG
jgi:hypothetical protein